MIYKEIIQKEVEKNQLVEIGVVVDLRSIADSTVAAFGTDKTFTPLVKIAFLNYFYKSVLQFGRFIEREKHVNAPLKKYCRRKVSELLTELRQEKPSVLDQEMKTGPLTIGYHLSAGLFHSLYQTFCESSAACETPADIRAFFGRIIEDKYPVVLDAYIGFLERDDPSFWEVTCRYIQELSAVVASFALQKLDRPMYHDIISDNTWSETYEIMRRRLVDQAGNVPVFQTGKDFRNYIIKTCHFLIINLHKRHAGKESSVEDYMLYGQGDADGTANEKESEETVVALPDEPSEAIEIENGIKELEIDVDNPYEVAYAVSIILLNTSHPLHSTLIEGIEDKVAILIDKTVNGMSYNDIVSELYGDKMDKEAFGRAVAKARKDYERVRKMLTERLKKAVLSRFPKVGDV